MKKAALLTVRIIVVACLVSCFAILVYFLYRARLTKAIQDVLEADQGLHRQVFAQASGATDSAEKVLAYTQGLREIDMSDCPTGFQLAYLDHIHAWESLGRARSFVIENVILSLLTKTIPTIPDEQPMLEEIARTWNEVERIALSYGVEVPK